MSRPMSRRPLSLLAAFAVAVLFLPFVPAAQGQSEKAEELYQQGKKLFDEKKSSEAEPLLLKAAKQGHADAQYLLGQSKAGKDKISLSQMVSQSCCVVQKVDKEGGNPWTRPYSCTRTFGSDVSMGIRG